MVALVARQSVMLKCNMQASVMLGNYEFYYGAGLFCKIAGLTPKEDIRPKELKEFLSPELSKFSGRDEKERYLVKLLKNYEGSDEYEQEMKELLLWGLKYEKLWEVN